MSNDDELMFADDGDHDNDNLSQTAAKTGQPSPWKILIADDEEEVHRVTQLSLRNVLVHGRPMQFLHAYTGRESVEIMREQTDIAMVLMDVVMEDEHAGLQAVQTIREELGNSSVRIVLRTGQPGQAPEYQVVTRYDINDYKEKTELTAKKLHTLMHTSLGHYRELMALKQNRAGLEAVIKASASIFESHSLQHFAKGVLTQLAALLYVPNNALMVRGVSAGRLDEQDGDLRVTAISGDSPDLEGRPIDEVLPATVAKRIRHARQAPGPYFGDGYFTAYFCTRTGSQHIVYLSGEGDFSSADRDLVELFCRNVGIAFENQTMHQEVIRSQHNLVLMLSSVVEERSIELRNHVRRVSAYAGVIGRKLGLAGTDIELLELSAALHDIGKIGVPDHILNKPGRLSPSEREIMEGHVDRGTAILSEQRGELLRTAGAVVGHHHERWDGKGYPQGLQGEEIHLFGRITAIADVFDALSTPRVYKAPWPVEEVVQYFRQNAGVQFDPALVEVFLDSLDDIMEIYDRWYVQTMQTA